MNIIQDFFQAVRDAQSDRRPHNILTGFPKYDYDLDGITQGQYILIGGETGTGKSKFVRNTYMHNVYEHVKRINNPAVLDVEFKDFSLELTHREILADAMARRMFKDHRWIIPYRQLFRKSDLATRLTPEQMTAFNQYETHFEDFGRKLSIISEEVTEQLFHDVLMETALSNGTFSTQADEISKCGVWTPNNPNKFIIVIVDTLNLADSENSAVKWTMDRISRMCVWYKNKCNFTFVIVQQFNSDISDFMRRKSGITTPILKDFMESTRPTKDCTLAIGMYAPWRHYKADKPKYKDYDIVRMGQWLIGLHVLKNRYGPSMTVVPMKFDGALGMFSELPHAAAMNEAEYIKATTH